MQKLKHYWHSYNGQVLQRILALIIPGYPLANSTALAIAEACVALGVSRVNATVAASLLSFALYTVIILWVFSLKTTGQVWRQLGAALLASLVIIAAFKGPALL